MNSARLVRFCLVGLLLSLVLAGCRTSARRGAPVTIHYVGSSTVAEFLKDAEPVYGRARFVLDTAPESEGGEQAILEGKTDFAGTANQPKPETLRAGVVSTLVARGAIAVIVHAQNPVKNLTLAQLRGIFAGQIRNWKEVGGPDLAIQPFIVGAESATRKVFRARVLGDADYAGCQEIRPDRNIIDAVAGTPGGIGQIGFAFLNGTKGVRAVAVEGEEPSVTNFQYPITRPLYLLWREGRPEIEAFVRWTQTDEGQKVVMRRLVGIRVVGAARAVTERTERGTLIVYTETYPVLDGGIYYYPHRPYTILSRHGEVIRRVPNHRGENDENPMRIELPPGTYLIRPETARGDRSEFFVRIENGKTTEVNVQEMIRRGK